MNWSINSISFANHFQVVNPLQIVQCIAWQFQWKRNDRPWDLGVPFFSTNPYCNTINFGWKDTRTYIYIYIYIYIFIYIYTHIDLYIYIYSLHSTELFWGRFETTVVKKTASVLGMVDRPSDAQWLETLVNKSIAGSSFLLVGGLNPSEKY